MSPEGELGLLLTLLVLSGLSSGSEVGFLSVGLSHARKLSCEGVKAASVLTFLLRHRSLALSTCLIAITASNYTAERLAVDYAMTKNPTLGPPVAYVVMLCVILLFCEVIPIQMAARDPEKIALRAAVPAAVASIVLSPFVLVFSLLSRCLLRLFGVHARTILPSVTEEYLKAMIAQGEEQGVIEATERRMLRGVLEFGDYTVAQIMTPRPDVICLEAGQTLGEALDLGFEHRHSRLPIYAGTPDDIIGVLYLKDLLPYAMAGDLDRVVSEVARPAYHVPESLRADSLLRQLQHGRQMMAIVMDEYGGTAGVATVEDLLEEIVGDIRDEYDVEEPEVILTGPGEFLCNARVSLHELQDYLEHTQLPTEDYESLAGLVMDIAGHIPAVEERVTYGALTLVIEEMNDKRVERIRVIETPETEETSEGSEVG